MSLSYEVLKQQNAETSNIIINNIEKNENFIKLSKFEGELTANRDKQDGDKLQVGIDFAKEKGVIDKDYVPEPYITLDVLGKNPNIISNQMLEKIKEGLASSDNNDKGFIIVLCGLSGTGKGTTVEALKEKLINDEKKEVVTWSNGNVFRSVTLLASTYCEQNNIDDIEKALTKENLESFMSMLSFGKYKDDKYDIKINGLGLEDVLVSDIQNTELKSTKVSKNIPTVAQYTQGEVITFASKAVDILSNAGIVVLLEGREQTVNYVRTPFRFTLTLSDEALIGKRRAAQRLAASTLKEVTAESSVDDISQALERALDVMVKEIE